MAARADTWFAPVWAEAWPRKYRRRGIVCQLSFLDLGGEEYVHGLDKSVLAAALRGKWPFADLEGEDGLPYIAQAA